MTRVRRFILATAATVGVAGCAAIWDIGNPYLAGSGDAGPDVTGAPADAPVDAPRSEAAPDAPASCNRSLTYRQVVLGDGPAAYLRLGESGCCFASDEQSAGVTGVYDDAGLTYGVPGAIKGDENTAVQFDGTHVVTMSSGLAFTGVQSFSVELWAMRTDIASGLNFAIDHGVVLDSGAKGSGWDMYLGDIDSSPGVVGERRDDTTHGASYAMTDAAFGADGQYHQLVMTFDGANYFCLYLDGQQVQCNPGAEHVSIDMAVEDLPWIIGNLNCGPGGGAGSTCSDGIIGNLDEISIYPYALDAAQVACHYAVATGA